MSEDSAVFMEPANSGPKGTTAEPIRLPKSPAANNPSFLRSSVSAGGAWDRGTADKRVGNLRLNHALAAPVRTRLYTAAIPGAWLLLGLAARAQNSGVTISIDVSAGRHRIDLGERGDTFFSTSRPANARQV